MFLFIISFGGKLPVFSNLIWLVQVHWYHYTFATSIYLSLSALDQLLLFLSFLKDGIFNILHSVIIAFSCACWSARNTWFARTAFRGCQCGNFIVWYHDLAIISRFRACFSFSAECLMNLSIEENMENKYHHSLQTVANGKKIFKHNRVSIENQQSKQPRQSE